MDNLENEPSETEDNQNQETTNTTDFEKQYKDVQSWSTKLSQENKDLQSRLDQVTGKLDGFMQTSNQQVAPAEEETPWLSDVDAIDLVDNPDKLKALLQEVRQSSNSGINDFKKELVDLLDLRDTALKEQYSKFDPKVLEQSAMVKHYASEIADLKNEEGLQGLDDNALAIIAKRTSSKPQFMQMTPSVSGQRVPMHNSDSSKFDKAVDAFLDKHGYNEANGFANEGKK